LPLVVDAHILVEMKWMIAAVGAASGALALALLLMAEQSSGPERARVSAAAPAAAPETAPRVAAEHKPDAAVAVRWVEFEGTCDASGAVAVDERHFAVADDEDNILRVYDAVAGGEPVRKTNLSKQIALKKRGEADIEAATSMGGRAFWLTSHGRNAKGEADPNRSLFITTDLPGLDEKVEVQGEVYRDLLADLQTDPSLLGYDLRHASELSPKQPGGLNIEGLSATPDGRLLIGFRSPVPRGRALILPIENPDALYTAGKPRFGVPIELDLGGLGVRSLSWWRGAYLIAAGPTAGAGPSRLYRWSGAGTPARLAAEAVFANANPEAFFSAEANDEVLVLSDDGEHAIHGKACKKLKGKKHKRFRGVWLKLPLDKT
jgi:Protein of unknown function (DUF3616)